MKLALKHRYVVGSTYLPIYKEKQLIKNLIEFHDESCLHLYEITGSEKN